MRNLRLKMGLQFYPGSTLSLARALSVATATLTHIEKEEKATNNEKINKKSKGKNEQIQRRHDHQEKLSNFQEHLPSQESKSVIESF